MADYIPKTDAEYHVWQFNLIELKFFQKMPLHGAFRKK